MHIEPVIWDSVFFHLTIGKINEGVFNRQEFLQEKEVFDLIYIFEKPESNNNAAISSINAVLVDEKITYKIILKNEDEIDAAIFVYTKDEPNDKLISLTLQSGIPDLKQIKTFRLKHMKNYISPGLKNPVINLLPFVF